MIGPVADSTVDPEIEEYKQEFGDKFMLEENLRELAERLKYRGQYVQYCFCTEKALKQLIKD